MASDSAFLQVFNSDFTYTPRPDPLPGDLRMSWGIAVLLLALSFSRGKKSNLRKLQFLAHSVRIAEGRDEVRGLLSGLYKPVDISVRVEPSLNRAVSFAHALKLVSVERGIVVSLTDAGAKLAQLITTESNAFEEEKSFLREVAPKVTDILMRRVWRLEDLL